MFITPAERAAVRARRKAREAADRKANAQREVAVKRAAWADAAALWAKQVADADGDELLAAARELGIDLTSRPDGPETTTGGLIGQAAY